METRLLHCLNCGTPLGTYRFGRPRLYCADCLPAQKKTMQQRNQAKLKDEKARHRRYCLDCDEEISHRHGLAKLCESCARERHRQHDLARSKTHRVQHDSCQVCGAPIGGNRGKMYCGEACKAKARQAQIKAKYGVSRTELTRRRNPDKAMVDRYTEAHRRRAAEAAVAEYSDLTPAEWRQIKKAFGNRCAYCGLPATKGNRLQVDHFIPLTRGGPLTARNVVPACVSCNPSKGNKLPHEWLESQGKLGLYLNIVSTMAECWGAIKREGMYGKLPEEWLKAQGETWKYIEGLGENWWAANLPEMLKGPRIERPVPEIPDTRNYLEEKGFTGWAHSMQREALQAHGIHVEFNWKER